MKGPIYYEIQEGMYSPRDKEYGYRSWGFYMDKNEAMKICRKTFKGQAFRLVQCQIIAEGTTEAPEWAKAS